MTEDQYAKTIALVERFSAAQEWEGFGFDPRVEQVQQQVSDTLAAGGGFDDLPEGARAFIDEAIAAAAAGETLNPRPVEDEDDVDEGALDDTVADAADLDDESKGLPPAEGDWISL